MVQPVEVRFEGTEYVGYYFGKKITKANSLERVMHKLYKYVKGQS